MKTRLIKNIIISGGGIPGAHALPGAINKLRQLISFDAIERVTGVSIGSLCGLMLTLKYSDDEIQKFIADTNFSKIKTASIFSMYKNLMENFGYHKVTGIYGIIQTIFSTKKLDPNMTFLKLKEISRIDFSVIATYAYEENSIPKSEDFCFCAESTPNTIVAHAIVASAAATPYLESVRLKKISDTEYVLSDDKNDLLFSDGGIRRNFPIDIYDSPKYFTPNGAMSESKETDSIINPETLGILIMSKAEIEHDPQKKGVITQIKSGDYLKYFYALFHDSKLCHPLKQVKEKHHDERTIKIDRLDVDLLDCDLKESKKKELYQSGVDAVVKFFNLPAENKEIQEKQATLTKVTTPVHSSLWTKSEKRSDETSVSTDKRTDSIELAAFSPR